MEELMQITKRQAMFLYDQIKIANEEKEMKR